MPSGIELSLSSLLPTVSPLPDELTNLATSLLAQSRSKAATLKPEEEIGRTYACCHIACQRLGHRLALDIAKPTPPVKPKVYTKLHTYLNSVLKTTTTPRSATRTRAVNTPTAQGPSTPSSRSKVLQAVSEHGVAETSPLATRSKATVVSPIATPRTRKRKADTQDIETAGEAVPPETDVQSEYDVEEGDEALNAGDDDERTVTSISRPSKTPLRRKEKHGSKDDDDFGPAGLLPGLGTMFQPAVEWLSDDRRGDYARWKQAILREVALVEQMT